MNTFQKHLVVSFLVALIDVSVAHAEPVAREYGVNLQGSAGRNWSEGEQSQYLMLNSSLLFINQHFHAGPRISIMRSYSSDWGSTSLEAGAIGKWTLEDLQTTKQTPFVTVAASAGRNFYSEDFETSSKSLQAAVGYETFLNGFVSLAPSLVWGRTWWDQKSAEYLPASTGKHEGATVALDLNVYL